MVPSYSSNLRAPTTASLPDTLQIPSTTRSLIRSFSRLPRTSILNLALEWLETRNQPLCAPYLSNNRSHVEETEEDYAYQPSNSIEELRDIYHGLVGTKGTKRDIIDRILEGDWRRGISLRQLAMLDFKCLEENESCLRWTALKLVEHNLKDGKEIAEDFNTKKNAKAAFPCIRISTFIQGLQREIAPLIKAHYHVHRLRSHNLTVVRLFVSDSPYSNVPLTTQRTFTDSARTVYIAFPDSCPFIYVSVSGTMMDSSTSNAAKQSAMADVASLKRLILEAVPKALSRPHHRIGLQSTSLSVKSLSAMMALRGNGRGNAAQGAFSIFADGSIEDGPLSITKRSSSPAILEHDLSEREGNPQQLQGPSGLKRRRSPLTEQDGNLSMARENDDEKQAKKRKVEAQRRFGSIGIAQDRYDQDQTRAPGHTASKPGGLDRFYVQLEEDLSFEAQTEPNTLPSSEPTKPAPLKLVFQGSNVFAGIRLLAENGVVDLSRMPNWMTGEDAVSSGTVRGGRMIDGKGGGS